MKNLLNFNAPKRQRLSRTTIKDIARVLSINPSTVSRALKDHPDIGKTLKAKIKTVADELGFTPNQYAVSLRNGKSNTIGLIVPEISTYFFPSVIKAIEEIVHERDYHLMVLHSNDQLSREVNNARICANVSVDGLLVSLTRETTDTKHFQQLCDNGVPIVYFDKTTPEANTYNVATPGTKAAYDAVNILFQSMNAPKKVCGIFGDERLSITRDRVIGFKQALAEHNYRLTNAHIAFANSTAEAATAFKKMYLLKDKPDAAFIMSDEILGGVTLVINELKIKVPEQLNVIALSDGFFPQFLPFKLPYIHTSGQQLGSAAASLLFNLIDKKDIKPGTYFTDIPFVLP